MMIYTNITLNHFYISGICSIYEISPSDLQVNKQVLSKNTCTIFNKICNHNVI